MDTIDRKFEEYFRGSLNVARYFLEVPPTWLSLLLALAIISLIDLTKGPEGLTVRLHATSLTALIIALAWLPSLLKIFALLGGHLKTSAGEVVTPGLFSINAKLFALLDRAAPNLEEDDRRRIEDIRREADQEYASYPKGVEQARADLATYSRAYDALRKELPPGNERTFQMGIVVSQVRAIASQARYTATETRAHFARGNDGDRIVALAMLQANPVVDCLDLVLNAIKESRSGFEQYQALRTAEIMLPYMSDADIVHLVEVFEYQREKFLKPENRAPWSLYETIMEQIEKRRGNDQGRC